MPAPCVLEALPYRKDDLTATYRPEYVRLRDEHGYAVARVDLRGTGSSDGLAVDEYPAQEQRDLCEVIAWLAEQPWCTGAVGMYGTSYSGFNSLQVACERPPALKAICAIYATDDRYTDDVHYMGGALPAARPRRLPGLHGGDERAAAGARRSSATGGATTWRARVDDLEPWLLRWLEEQRDSAYWRHGSLRPAYDRIELPDDARRRLGRRLPQQHVPHRRRRCARPARRTGCCSGRGATCRRRRRCPGRTSTWCR